MHQLNFRLVCLTCQNAVQPSFHTWRGSQLLQKVSWCKRSLATFRYRAVQPAYSSEVSQPSVRQSVLNNRRISVLPASSWFTQSVFRVSQLPSKCTESRLIRTLPAGFRCSQQLTRHGVQCTTACRHLTLSPKAIVEASPHSLQPYLRLIRFDRPIGTWLLFLPCAWSISLAAPAGHLPDPWMLTLFALGSFSMRAAACTINDMWDKDFDARVTRTKDRPLACGEISQFKALVFLALPLSASLGILLTFNWNTVALGACSMIPCIIYPLMKRVTYWPQAFLGITLNWGVMIAWSAIRGSIDLPGLVLYSSCVLWTMIYDTIYSHQDKSDDIKVGVKSLALKLGDQAKLGLSGMALGVSGGLLTAGYMCDQAWPYYLGVSVVAAHFAHQIHSVDLKDPDSCGQTFRSNRNLGLVFWAFVVASGLLMEERKDSSKARESSPVD